MPKDSKIKPAYTEFDALRDEFKAAYYHTPSNQPLSNIQSQPKLTNKTTDFSKPKPTKV